MQQLLGRSAMSVDDALFCELFLQRLPSSVRRILASSSETVNVQSLAEIADKILEATPAHVAAEGDISQLRSYVGTFRVYDLVPHIEKRKMLNDPALIRQISVGITKSSVLKPTNVNHHVPTRETVPPVTGGDQCSRQIPKSLAFHQSTIIEASFFD
ncbi:hypothetical protein M514_11150 [Trichuris suis]|uniref:Uncharacterized protein n=1 Tax=Trichuris suis TaxID=68888 RepID=A0A085N8C7_9BILA|nr:hypothetical protein M513_11150 [Trichuris suis]KFD65723.1 hypothetical protein M514_11150 [Trichuris suis]KHJ43693.1 hypothetical protein D918_06198 [Trichuris suis]